MNCEQALEYLIRKMDNDLNHLEEKDLAQHLALCSHCALVAEEFEESQKDLAGYFQDIPIVSPDFTNKVMSKIREDKKENLWRSPILKAACFLVTLGIITALALPLLPKQSNSPKESISQIAQTQLPSKEENTPAAISEPVAEEQKVEQTTIDRAIFKENPTPKAKQQEIPVPEEEPRPSPAKEENSVSEPIQVAQAKTGNMTMMRTLVAAPSLVDQISPHVPEGYVLAKEAQEKDEDGQTKAIHLYYLPNGEELTEANQNYLYISLDQENTTASKQQGDKEVIQSLENGLVLTVRSEKLEPLQLAKIANSLLTANLSLR